MSREGSCSLGPPAQVMLFVCFLLSCMLQNMSEKAPLPACIVMNELLVLEVLQHTDFCSGETEHLCKAAAVKAVICVALVPAEENRVWSRGRWSRPHRAPPAASSEQTATVFVGLPGFLLLCLRWASASGEVGRTMPNTSFYESETINTFLL